MNADVSRKSQVGVSARPATRRSMVWATVLGLLVGTAAWGAMEFAVVQPISTETDRLSIQLQYTRSENERTETMIANYDEFREEADRVEADYAVALSAVPSEAELAAALADVERVTGASGVRLVAFEPGKLAAKAPPARPGNAEPTTNTPLQVEARPVSVVIHSRYEPTQSLLNRLATYPRLITVESFSLRSHVTGAYTTEASLTLNCYYKVAPATVAQAKARH